jgi:hypothetical protein
MGRLIGAGKSDSINQHRAAELLRECYSTCPSFRAHEAVTGRVVSVKTPAKTPRENFIAKSPGFRYDVCAGWSSLVARWAHNPKVAGSNPAPATMGTFRDNRKVPFLLLVTS